jgi:hypothetical protein
MKPAKHLTFIESLESRIAPALILNPYTVSFQDADGDTAVVRISKPLFTNATTAGKILNFTNAAGTASIQESFTSNTTAENLSEINLLARTDATGLNISVTVLPQVGIGNLHVDVGGINAANFNTQNQVSQNIDLGNIYIQGNLGYINAGASNYYFTPSVQSLTVASMTLGEDSNILGPIGSLNIQGDFSANLSVIGYQFGSIGKLNIGGSLTVDSAGQDTSGEITFTGSIGSATIGNIIGGAGTLTGALVGSSANPSHIGTVTITGSTGIEGGSGNYSGLISAQAGIGKVNIINSAAGITGGSGDYSGQIAGPLGTVNIAGSVTGGSGLNSGSIFSEYGSTTSTITPTALGSVLIGGDLHGGTAGSSGTAGNTGIISATSTGSITIGGSLIGGSYSSASLDADTSGAILANSVKNLVIVGNVTGGSGANSGLITSQPDVFSSSYGNIFISGNITGGSGDLSGAIDFPGVLGGSISNLHIGSSVMGSSGTTSGIVFASGNLKTLSIGGSILGGSISNSGEVISGGTLGNALIKGNLTGGVVTSTTAVTNSGYLQAGTITSLEIKGNVTSGSNSNSAGIANSGDIRAGANIVSIAIDGAVTGTGTNPVIISAASGPFGTTKTDLAIARATFGKSVSYLDLLAGYTPTVSTSSGGTTNPVGAPLGTPADATAQIGTVSVTGNLSATNIVAGVIGVNGTNFPASGKFGTANDTAISTGGIAHLHSSIANIIIQGTAAGDSTTGDSFGFVAQEVVAAKVDGVNVDLNAGPDNDFLVPVSGNLYVNEVPAA